MDRERTRHEAFQVIVDTRDAVGVAELGLMNNQVWHDDPRRLVFTLSRYKFVSKMLSGCESVLEIGCGDAFGTRIVQQEVGHVTAIDYDPIMIADVNRRMTERWRFGARVHDILREPVPGTYDAIFGLDVFEHIPPEQNDRMLEHLKCALKPEGILILGIPSLESQAYASPPSRLGHVNCRSGSDFRRYMRRHFANVFMFSMNDEVVHTGFFPMAHYLIAVCCQPKRIADLP